ncbi:hypothetical protein ACTXG5_15740 [Mycobacterium sp. Dal123C01]
MTFWRAGGFGTSFIRFAAAAKGSMALGDVSSTGMGFCDVR